ncbi:single-stranded DNA-binding protein [Crocosphaera sp. Alani8]|uniref:single-stranded DNA-binding protein n=1 Tax=Crocosphaera sp. Alani8 TaxID=3038952 RepID=UPI00313EF11F
MKQIYLPPIIIDFLKQQAISQPQYHKPVRLKSKWPKLSWFVWGAMALVVFQLTIIISLSYRINNGYVVLVLVSLLMMGLGGIGGWWWVKSVYSSPEHQLYQYNSQQYQSALKLLQRQQHRKLRQLLAGNLPELVKENKLTPLDKKIIGLLKKKYSFLQVLPKMKVLKDEDWIDIPCLLISQRTNVLIGVFFIHNDLEESSWEKLLETEWVILPVKSLETLVNILNYLRDKLNLI